MNEHDRLSSVDLLAEPNLHMNASSLRFRGAGKFCEPGELAVVDVDHAASTRCNKWVDIDRLRWRAQASLRLADGFKL